MGEAQDAKLQRLAEMVRLMAFLSQPMGEDGPDPYERWNASMDLLRMGEEHGFLPDGSHAAIIAKVRAAVRKRRRCSWEDRFRYLLVEHVYLEPSAFFGPKDLTNSLKLEVYRLVGEAIEISPKAVERSYGKVARSGGLYSYDPETGHLVPDEINSLLKPPTVGRPRESW